MHGRELRKEYPTRYFLPHRPCAAVYEQFLRIHDNQHNFDLNSFFSGSLKFCWCISEEGRCRNLFVHHDRAEDITPLFDQILTRLEIRYPKHINVSEINFKEM